MPSNSSTQASPLGTSGFGATGFDTTGAQNAPFGQPGPLVGPPFNAPQATPQPAPFSASEATPQPGTATGQQTGGTPSVGPAPLPNQSGELQTQGPQLNTLGQQFESSGGGTGTSGGSSTSSSMGTTGSSSTSTSGGGGTSTSAGSSSAQPQSAPGGGSAARGSVAGGSLVALTPAERRKVREIILSQTAAQEPRANFKLIIGAKVPGNVSLRPMPQEAVNVVPKFKDFDFTVVDDRIVVVQRSTREIDTMIPI